MALVPDVIVRLLADTKEFTAKFDEAEGKLTSFGVAADASGSKLAAFTSKAATGIVALGVAFAGVAADQAYKFQESLDKIRNQAGLTQAQTDALGNSILKISNETGVAAEQLSGAALTISQAGIRGAQANELLTASAKAAVITNASVADTTKAIVAAQTLQIAKGMDVTKLTGILVQGSKEFVGGLSAEEQMLSGRVGVALSNYGLSLKTVISLGAEFAKVGLPTRSISTFANALGTLEKPMTNAKGKLTTYAQGLERVGLSYAELARMARTGNIVGILQAVQKSAEATGAPLSQIANAVFGTSGGAAASVLVKNLQQVQQIQQQMAGSGAGSLQSGMQLALTQLGPQLQLLKTNLTNLMISAGKMLLPAISDIAKWGGDILSWFDTHPLIKTIASDAAIGTFAAALGLKVVQGIQSAVSTVKNLFGLGSTAANTTALDANTAAIETLTGAVETSGIGGAGAGAVGAAEGAGVAGAAKTVGGALVGTLAGAAALTGAAGLGLALAATSGPTPAQMTAQQKEESRYPMPISKPAKVTPVAKPAAKTVVNIHYKKA